MYCLVFEWYRKIRRYRSCRNLRRNQYLHPIAVLKIYEELCLLLLNAAHTHPFYLPWYSFSILRNFHCHLKETNFHHLISSSYKILSAISHFYFSSVFWNLIDLIFCDKIIFICWQTDRWYKLLFACQRIDK